MLNKIIAASTVLIALILAILAVSLNEDQISAWVSVYQFFDATLLVLGVGALFIYLLNCPRTQVISIVLVWCFLLLAIILGLLAAFSASLSVGHLQTLMLISRFLEVMLPILGVGALIKFLFSSKHGIEKEKV